MRTQVLSLGCRDKRRKWWLACNPRKGGRRNRKRVTWKLTASDPGVQCSRDRWEHASMKWRRGLPNVVLCQTHAGPVCHVSKHIMICQTINKWKEFKRETNNRPTNYQTGKLKRQVTLIFCAHSQKFWELRYWCSTCNSLNIRISTMVIT